MRILPLWGLSLACSETGVSALDNTQVPPDEEALRPAIQVEPAQITFDAVAAGDRATELFTVTNVGEAPLDVLRVVLQEGPSTFSFQALDGTLLEPGDTSSWSVSFAPTEMTTEVEQAKIGIRSNDPDRATVSVDLEGSLLLPEFVLEPASHDFGVVNAGDRASTDFVVRNVGDAVGTISGLEFTASSPELVFANPALQDALPTYIEPGAELSIPIDYAPIDALRDEGTLVVLSDAPTTPSLNAVVQGEGFAPDRDIELFLTADDAWTGFIDGTEYTATHQNDWQRGDTLTATVPAGQTVIAIQATDVGSVISGFIAVVKVDGTIVSRTGEGDWLMTSTDPGPGWQDASFDDSSWSPAVKCTSSAVWGTYWPKPFYDEGAEWVWWTATCRDLRQAWFRLKLET
ncbi:MAG: choice-of-anchor D domain-containing protein [Myxococcota bacterium]